MAFNRLMRTATHIHMQNHMLSIFLEAAGLVRCCSSPHNNAGLAYLLYSEHVHDIMLVIIHNIELADFNPFVVCISYQSYGDKRSRTLNLSVHRVDVSH